MLHPCRLAKVLLLLLLPATALGLAATAAGRSVGTDIGVPGFRTLDRNADGFVSRDEADAVKAISLLFGVADANGDDRLSPEEYRIINIGTTRATAGGLRG